MQLFSEALRGIGSYTPLRPGSPLTGDFDVVRRLRWIAERNGDGGNVGIDRCRAMERRPGYHQLRTVGDRNPNGNAGEEADLDGQRGSNFDADVEFVCERIPRDQEVDIAVEPGADRPEACCGAERASRHDAGIGEREVSTAFNDDIAADAPVESQPWDIGELGRLDEDRVVPAQRQHELPLREPREEGEAARKLAIGVEEIRVIGKLCLDRQRSFFRVVAGFERQLDTDQREFLGGQGHARDAENVDLEAALERDHHYDGAVHQCEGGDTHAGGKPVGAATGRN